MDQTKLQHRGHLIAACNALLHVTQTRPTWNSKINKISQNQLFDPINFLIKASHLGNTLKTGK